VTPPAKDEDAAGVVRTYDRYAPLYDRIFGAVLEPGRRALANAVTTLCNGSARTLLEVGVGTGLTLPLYPGAMDVTGVDVSDHMLDKARARAREMPDRNISLQLMDGERLAFDDGSFDCVTLPYVLSVTPHPDKLVAEVRRVCRKGGVILVLNHFSGSPFWWTFERAVKPLADRVGFRSDFAFDQQITRHGWEVQEVKSVNLLGLSKLVSIRNA
jgi:phosphatidylethanolamine/phosphatidyl-N-methylethanolamine N-methyltransferase